MTTEKKFTFKELQDIVKSKQFKKLKKSFPPGQRNLLRLLQGFLGFVDYERVDPNHLDYINVNGSWSEAYTSALPTGKRGEYEFFIKTFLSSFRNKYVFPKENFLSLNKRMVSIEGSTNHCFFLLEDWIKDSDKLIATLSPNYGTVHASRTVLINSVLAGFHGTLFGGMIYRKGQVNRVSESIDDSRTDGEMDIALGSYPLDRQIFENIVTDTELVKEGLLFKLKLGERDFTVLVSKEGVNDNGHWIYDYVIKDHRNLSYSLVDFKALHFDIKPEYTLALDESSMIRNALHGEEFDVELLANITLGGGYVSHASKLYDATDTAWEK